MPCCSTHKKPRPFTSLLAVMPLLWIALGCQVRQPGTVETRVAGFIKTRITVAGKTDTNPLAATAENVEAGRQAFSQYCMVCHGLDGQNTGVPFAEKMSPAPPPLNSRAVQQYTDGQLKWVIDHGIFPSGMPASKGTLGDDEIWEIVTYIRHLPPKGSLGEPAVYTGEPQKGPKTKQAVHRVDD
jgi:mono/diheme cytochrome c family protein